MHRRIAQILASFPVAAVITSAGAARADAVTDRVHLVLPDGPDGVACDAMVFRDALAQRVTALSPAWRDLRLEAEVTKQGDGLEGRVWATSDVGAGAARSVLGPTCATTLRSLALLAAIALDAASRARERDEEEARVAPSLDASPGAPSTVATSSALPLVGDASRPDPSAERPIAARQPDSVRRVLRPLVGASVEASSLGLSVSPFLGVERRHGWWPTAFRVGAVFGGGDVAPNIPDLHTRSTWLAGRVEGCPWQLELTSSLNARPCLAVDVGVVRTDLVSATSAPPALPGGPSTDPRSALWVAPRLTVRLGFDVFSWLRLEADGAVAAGLSAPEWVSERGFVMTPQWPIVALAAGAAVRFP